MAGWWECDNLTSLFQIFCQNQHVFQNGDGILSRMVRWFHRVSHWWRSNTLQGSRANIHAHYDLGNAFFAKMLDDTMMYSSALFEPAKATLRDASVAKLDRICQKLRVAPRDHVLEIGTGWGGFALHAAREYGCRVTTTTISREQFDYASAQVRAANLQDRVTVVCRDYRELTGIYDKIVSIEMIEAVGRRYLETFFQTCDRLLKPTGAMLLQAITMPEPLFDAYCRNVDFIQRYIFPGGFLPSLTCLSQAMARASTLRWLHLEDFGPHYATTLRHWRGRFTSNLNEILRLGYSESFLRMWEFYLCYCEAGFLERVLGLAQIVLTKPGNRLEPILGKILSVTDPAESSVS